MLYGCYVSYQTEAEQKISQLWGIGNSKKHFIRNIKTLTPSENGVCVRVLLHTVYEYRLFQILSLYHDPLDKKAWLDQCMIKNISDKLKRFNNYNGKLTQQQIIQYQKKHLQ